MTHDLLDADLDRLRAAHLRIPDPDPERARDARRRVLATIPDDRARSYAVPSGPRRRARRVLGVAAAGLLVAGTAVAATTPWNPRLGGGPHREPATRSTRAVPRAFTDRLAVLRRPQSAEDRTAGVQRTLELLDRQIAGGVYVDGIRRLQDGPGGTVALVPMRRYGPKDQPGVAPQLNGLCVYVAQPRTAGRGYLGGGSCGTVEDLDRRGIGSITTRLVPDGVARVRVTLRNGRTLTAEVRDNYYALPFELPEVPFPADGRTTPELRAAQRRADAALRQILGRPKFWLDARGRVLRRTF